MIGKDRDCNDARISGCHAAAPPAQQMPSAAAEAAVQTVDFVCEADVRAALRENRKIQIGPRTIVTPSARELAAPSDILVVAQG